MNMTPNPAATLLLWLGAASLTREGVMGSCQGVAKIDFFTLVKHNLCDSVINLIRAGRTIVQTGFFFNLEKIHIIK
ncbi:hypothetical protein GQ55_7G329700 [Panicum hallii var. hallii]|uniref:Secreted protein n=1 Tax=Panicum hallii var. hallii TaxID=1504633 RepID=A0A2T7D1T8_9POAL|nr:hypothetical protein GQ55_7G329700 [Panicum hallii var. hallii]